MKKNCNIIRDLLPLYLDDVCSEESKKIVAEHLENCEECMKYLEQLKYSVKIAKSNEVNVFQKFIKKINFKIIRNSILITAIILAVIIPIVGFVNCYEYNVEYSDDMEILFWNNDGSTKWNFQFSAVSPWGYAEGTRIRTSENGEAVNLIFINWQTTLRDTLASKIAEMKNGGQKLSAGPDLDYASINPKEKMKVYYTTEKLDKIDNASKEELQEIIKNSKLMFTKDEKTTTIKCNLKEQEYTYTLTYYDINKQIISSVGDENMPEYLLQQIYSVNGDYKSVWFPGDTFTKIYNEINDYMKDSGGSCTY